MPITVSVTERALQLARSRACRTVADIRAQLVREKHARVGEYLAGPSIQAQLKRLLAERAAADV